MKPNSEYILAPINNEENSIEITESNKEPKNHRVELFINNEYKGIYSLETINERLPNKDE